jgi:hypothetical protein
MGSLHCFQEANGHSLGRGRLAGGSYADRPDIRIGESTPARLFFDYVEKKRDQIVAEATTSLRLRNRHHHRPFCNLRPCSLHAYEHSDESKKRFGLPSISIEEYTPMVLEILDSVRPDHAMP